jgi:hypothetical protein
MSTRLNKYTCKSCGGEIITIDIDEGTTPFMLLCRVKADCGGHMYSSFYRNVHGKPTYQWRKPTLTEYRQSSAATKQHYEMGGLGIWPYSEKPT